MLKLEYCYSTDRGRVKSFGYVMTEIIPVNGVFKDEYWAKMSVNAVSPDDKRVMVWLARNN